MNGQTIGSYAAGVVCGNCLPHLATAAAGRRLMTPFAGRTSGRWANLAWGAANLAAGLTLAAACRGEAQHWTGRLSAFGAGAATFSAWSVIGEAIFKFNTRPELSAIECRSLDSNALSGRRPSVCAAPRIAPWAGLSGTRRR